MAVSTALVGVSAFDGGVEMDAGAFGATGGGAGSTATAWPHASQKRAPDASGLPQASQNLGLVGSMGIFVFDGYRLTLSGVVARKGIVFFAQLVKAVHQGGHVFQFLTLAFGRCLLVALRGGFQFVPDLSHLFQEAGALGHYLGRGGTTFRDELSRRGRPEMNAEGKGNR